MNFTTKDLKEIQDLYDKIDYNTLLYEYKSGREVVFNEIIYPKLFL